MPRLITALDIGSSTLKAAVCSLEKPSKISILGLETFPSKGVQSGNVIDFNTAEKDIFDILQLLEKKSGRRIRSVSVTLSGSGIEALEGRGMIPLGKRARQITKQDVKSCVKVAGMFKLPIDRESIGEAVSQFYINENEPIANPIGLFSTKLGVKIFILAADCGKVKNLYKIIEGTGRIVENVVASSVAQAESVFSEKHKTGVTALIDIGSHTTSTALFENESIKDINCINHGARSLLSSHNITAYMEAVKRLFKSETINHVLLTGGGALEDDVIETAESVFGVPCELGSVRLKWCRVNPAESVVHTTTLGLVNFEAKRILSGYELENPFIKVRQFLNDLMDDYF